MTRETKLLTALTTAETNAEIRAWAFEAKLVTALTICEPRLVKNDTTRDTKLVIPLITLAIKLEIVDTMVEIAPVQIAEIWFQRLEPIALILSMNVDQIVPSKSH